MIWRIIRVCGSECYIYSGWWLNAKYDHKKSQTKKPSIEMSVPIQLETANNTIKANPYFLESISVNVASDDGGENESLNNSKFENQLNDTTKM